MYPPATPFLYLGVDLEHWLQSPRHFRSDRFGGLVCGDNEVPTIPAKLELLERRDFRMDLETIRTASAFAWRTPSSAESWARSTKRSRFSALSRAIGSMKTNAATGPAPCFCRIGMVEFRMQPAVCWRLVVPWLELRSIALVYAQIFDIFASCTILKTAFSSGFRGHRPTCPRMSARRWATPSASKHRGCNARRH